MKLAINAHDKKLKKDFNYALEIPDYVIISVAAMVTGAIITKTVMNRKVGKKKWYSQIFK